MKKQLDLGCSGFTRNEPGYDEVFGVDIVDHSEESNCEHIRQADLIIEPIPFDDSSFDLVTAHDFLEHIPFVIYLYDDALGRNIRRDAMIELFNEIYRVLKLGGKFYAKMPCYPNRSIFQDPQHLSFWTDETPNYFSGDYYGFKEHYGHKSNFKLLDKHVDGNGHLHFTMKAVK